VKRRASLAIAVALAGCGRHTDAPSPAASTGTLAAPSVSAARAEAAPSANAEPSADMATGRTLLSPGACRAIAVKGTVTGKGGVPLVTGDALDRTSWFSAKAGASIAVKNTETSRELVFHGPAEVLPCEHGEERFLMTEGHVETATWAGARPGAEVLIATPFAAVRYGDAKLDVSVDAKGLTVTSDTGDAWVWLAGAASEEKIPGGKRFEKRGRAPDVKTLVADCEKRAEDAESRARAVLVPGNSAAPLGVRAAEHVRARKAARASCAIAAAAVQTSQAEVDKDSLGRRVSYADARWRSVPPRVSSAQKVESR
jgi:hypothetical protein